MILEGVCNSFEFAIERSPRNKPFELLDKKRHRFCCYISFFFDAQAKKNVAKSKDYYSCRTLLKERSRTREKTSFLFVSEFDSGTSFRHLMRCVSFICGVFLDSHLFAFSKQENSVMQESKLYVGNLNYSVTNEELEELFGSHGAVKSVNVIDGKGFGFVEMGSSAEADEAQEALNGTEFKGRTLKVDKARPPKNRQRRPTRNYDE
jgi:hypothetical protein